MNFYLRPDGTALLTLDGRPPIELSEDEVISIRTALFPPTPFNIIVAPLQNEVSYSYPCASSCDACGNTLCVDLSKFRTRQDTKK